jgi:hypothetical protein
MHLEVIARSCIARCSAVVGVPARLTRRRPRLQGSPTPSGALRASTPRSWLSARQSATRIGMHLLAVCAVRQGHKREEGPARNAFA